MRWIRTGAGDSKIKPCDACMEGNNVNDDREGRAIAQYLATGDNGGRWIKLDPAELSEHRLAKIRQDREDADAYHREWASIYSNKNAHDRWRDRWKSTNDAIAAQGIEPLSGPELLRLAPEQGRNQQRKPRKSS